MDPEFQIMDVAPISPSSSAPWRDNQSMVNSEEAPMLDVLLLFPQAESDGMAIDEVLTQRLVPAFRRASGIRSLRLSAGTLMSRGGTSPYSRVLEASFDTLADWMAVVDALNSPGPRGEREAFDRLAPLVIFFEVSEALEA